MQDSDFQLWGVEETCRYLRKEALGEWEDTFRAQKVTGANLRDLNDENLRGIGIKCLGDRLRVLRSLGKLWQIKAELYKVFNDPVHGTVELHPLLIRFIDTPQFQRLRNIKQLGGTYYVFPGASHNRFEHSIGVAFLAGQLVQALRERQPELDISDRDVLCVQIAGLCHDLGHGPFSHVFDKRFLPKARPEFKKKHEAASLRMFDYLVEKNKLEPVMKEHGLELPEDLDFIKQLIDRPQDTGQEWPYKGRPKGKSFLYEIVANKRNCIDVDKWDYFARDCHHLGIQNNFDYHRILKFARVCEVGGQKQICYRDKEVDNLYEMFHTRYRLHRRAYQHKVGNIIEIMITEAFLKADKHIQIEGSGGKKFTLSTAIDDMEAYTKLTDTILELILNFPSLTSSRKEELEEARETLGKVIRRDLYKYLGQTKPKEPSDVDQETENNWKDQLSDGTSQSNTKLEPDDFVIDVINFNYGMKEKNPIKKVRFYSKNDPTKAEPIPENEESKLIPQQFAEQLIRVYCKKKDEESLKAARSSFEQWKENFSQPQSED